MGRQSHYNSSIIASIIYPIAADIDTKHAVYVCIWKNDTALHGKLIPRYCHSGWLPRPPSVTVTQVEVKVICVHVCLQCSVVFDVCFRTKKVLLVCVDVGKFQAD